MKKQLLFVILFAFIVRFALFLIAQPWTEDVEQNRIVRSDAIGYHELAVRIVSDFTFELDNEKNSFRTPGYPVFISMIYFIFGSKPYIVLIFQIFINLLSIFLVFKIAHYLFNEKIALIASFLYSIDPHTVLYTCELFTETLFTFIIILSFFYFIKGLKLSNLKYFILSGLFFGLSALIRPISLFIPFVLVGLIFIYSKFKFKFKIKSSFIIVSFFVLAITPWLYRNYRDFNSFSLSSLPAYNLIFYNVAFTEYAKTGEDLDLIRNNLSSEARLNGADFSHWTSSDAKTFKNVDAYDKVSKTYIKNNFFQFSFIHIKNSLFVYLNVGTKGILSMLRFKEIELPAMAASSLKENIINIIKFKSPFEIALIVFIGLFFSIYIFVSNNRSV